MYGKIKVLLLVHGLKCKTILKTFVKFWFLCNYNLTQFDFYQLSYLGRQQSNENRKEILLNNFTRRSLINFTRHILVRQMDRN